MARIEGSVGANGSRYHYWIDWGEDSTDIVNNTTRVYATVYIQRTSSYTSEGSNNTILYIDGQSFGNGSYINMNPNSNPIAIVSGSAYIGHNSDGTKQINISSSSNPLVYGGGYGPASGSASATVTLTTIPRAANITNAADFTIETSPYLYFNNPGNLYVSVDLYMSDDGGTGHFIKRVQFGQSSQGSFALNGNDSNLIYSYMVNAQSRGFQMYCQTWTDGSYSTQVGGNQERDNTLYVNTGTNPPNWTTYTIANVDKSIIVQDKYGNTLITSSTATLLGTSGGIIKGYSKISANITLANRAIAKNYANLIKYRLVVNAQQIENGYSNTVPITIYLDNVDSLSTNITAFDSRSLTTTVTNNFPLMANFVPVSLFNATMTRDNNVDALTKLSFNAQFWKKYFSSDSTTNSGGGVLNSVTIAFRWKYTTDTWGSQSWTTLTITSDSTGYISYNAYVNGDLGVSGFDTNKSFDIEMRIYDLLSQNIVNAILSVGIPLVDYNKGGIAIKQRYSSNDSAAFQLNGAITLANQSTTPSNPYFIEGHLYIRNTKLIIQYNDSATIRYKYLDLTGTGSTWVSTTTPP